ncbi:MAG: response regulator transcription factor [Phycisphaerae bacterium]
MTQPDSAPPRSTDDRLLLSDVTRLLRLTGEVACLRDDPRTWRLSLLNSLNQLLPSAVSAAFILKNTAPDAPPLVVSVFDAGFKSETQRQTFLREFNTAPFRDPFFRTCIDRFLETRPKCLTALRRDFVDDDRWYSSPHLEEYRRPANLDDALFSIHQGANRGDALVLCAFRAWEGSPHPAHFSPRERLILDALHNGLDWIYKSEEATQRLTRASALAPRLRQTLEYLLAGHTERQVALKMSLSVHTVHDYVKALYLHFGVSSRGELISRWMQTGGQITPPTS